jgi:hypothetical protein
MVETGTLGENAAQKTVEPAHVGLTAMRLSSPTACWSF